MSTLAPPVLERPSTLLSVSELPSLGANALTVVPPATPRRVVVKAPGQMKVSDIATYDPELANALYTRLDCTKLLGTGVRVGVQDASAVLTPHELARFDTIKQGLRSIALPYQLAHAGTALTALLVAVAAALQGDAFTALATTGVGLVGGGMLSAVIYGEAARPASKARHQALLTRVAELRGAAAKTDSAVTAKAD